jgi:hypothetical protein
VRLQELQVEIRPRTTGQTLAIAARMLQQRPGPLLWAWALSSVPLIAVSLLLLLVVELDPWWIWAIILPIAPAFGLPMIATTGMLVFTPAVRPGEVASVLVRRTLPYLTAFLAMRVLALAGFAAMVVPGLYIWRYSWFLAPIVLLERSPLGVSLRRSRRFAVGFHGHVLAHAASTGAVLGYAFVAFGSLAHFLIAEVLGLGIESISYVTDYVFYPHVVALVGFGLAVPLALLVWFFVYLDVRIRKEGWDLEIEFRSRAEQLEASRGA